MTKLCMVIFHKQFPMVVIPLPTPTPCLELVIDGYAKTWCFKRNSLSYTITEVLEKEEAKMFADYAVKHEK